MKRLALLGLVFCSVWASGRGQTADALHYPIVKEPQYRGTPQYLCLVFGREQLTPMWFVLDEDSLYLDKNSNGDLTDAGEAIVHNNSTCNFALCDDVPAEEQTQILLRPDGIKPFSADHSFCVYFKQGNYVILYNKKYGHSPQEAPVAMLQKRYHYTVKTSRKGQDLAVECSIGSDCRGVDLLLNLELHFSEQQPRLTITGTQAGGERRTILEDFITVRC